MTEPARYRTVRAAPGATSWRRQAETLHQFGYRGLRARGLKGWHIEALVAEWRRQGLADGTGQESHGAPSLVGEEDWKTGDRAQGQRELRGRRAVRRGRCGSGSAGRDRAEQESGRPERELDRGPDGAGGSGREHEKAAGPKPKTPDVDLGV